MPTRASGRGEAVPLMLLNPAEAQPVQPVPHALNVFVREALAGHSLMRLVKQVSDARNSGSLPDWAAEDIARELDVQGNYRRGAVGLRLLKAAAAIRGQVLHVAVVKEQWAKEGNPRLLHREGENRLKDKAWVRGQLAREMYRLPKRMDHPPAVAAHLPTVPAWPGDITQSYALELMGRRANPAGVCLICRRPYNRKREGEVTTAVYSPAGQPHTLAFCRSCAGGESPEAGQRFDKAVDVFLKRHPGWTEERPNPCGSRRNNPHPAGAAYALVYSWGMTETGEPLADVCFYDAAGRPLPGRIHVSQTDLQAAVAPLPLVSVSEMARIKRSNPDLPWHRRQREEYRDRLAGDLAAHHGQGAEFWQGALSAEDRSLAQEMGERMKRQGELKPERLVWRLGLKNIPRDKLMAMLVDPLPDWQKTLINIELSSREIRKINPCGSRQGNPTHAEDRSVAREMGERMKRQGELKPERLVWRLGLKNIPRDKLMAMLVDPLPDWQKTLINIELSSREIRKINPCGSRQGNPTHLYGPFVLVRDNRQLAGQYQSYQVALREAHRMLADASSFVSIHDEGVKSARAVKTLWARPRLGEKENPADPIMQRKLEAFFSPVIRWKLRRGPRSGIGVYQADTVADRQLARKAGVPGYFNEDEFDKWLAVAGRVGVSFETAEENPCGGRRGNPGELKIGPTGFVLWGGREWSIDLQSPNGIYLLRGWARDLRGKLYPEWLVLHNNLMQAQGPIRENMVAAWRRAIEEGPQGLEGRQGNPAPDFRSHRSSADPRGRGLDDYTAAELLAIYNKLWKRTRVKMGGAFDGPTLLTVMPQVHAEMRQLDAAYRRALLREGAPPALASEQTPRFFRGNPTPYEEEMLRRTRRTPGRRDLARSGAFIDGLLQAQRNRPPHELRGRSAEYAARYREGYRLGLGESERQMRESRRRGNPPPPFGLRRVNPGETGQWYSHLNFYRREDAVKMAKEIRAKYPGTAVKVTKRIHRGTAPDGGNETVWHLLTRKGNPTPRQGFETFHNAAPDRTRRVKVPPGWPTKLWMLGSLKLLELKSGRRISGGTVCAATGNRIYIINAHYTGRLSPGERAAQIEYIAPSVSERAGPVWFHPFDKPPSVRETAHGFLTLTGKGLRLTRRGIVG